LEVQNSAFVFNNVLGGPIGSHPAGGQAGAGLGGAIHSRDRLTVINCTLAENRAQGGEPEGWYGSGGSAFGGAIYAEGEGSLLNVTIAGNQVAAGVQGDVPFYPKRAGGSSIATTNGTVRITNSILSCVSAQTNVFGAIVDGGHNISSDTSAAFTSSTSENAVDPRLGPLANNGGPTPTMALLPDSPAIDAGDTSMCLPTDQRGETRPKGAACDIGAFELAPKLSLTFDPSGMAKLSYAFRSVQPVVIRGSTNLTHWVELGSGSTDTNGVFEVTDPALKLSPWRFYSPAADAD
jgi:hypothetical protein